MEELFSVVIDTIDVLGAWLMCANLPNGIASPHMANIVTVIGMFLFAPQPGSSSDTSK